MCISKGIKWILKKPLRILFLHIFAIHSSSRHEKRCQMLETLFGYFNALKTHGDYSQVPNKRVGSNKKRGGYFEQIS